MNLGKTMINGATVRDSKQSKDLFTKEVRPQLYAFLKSAVRQTMPAGPSATDVTFLVGRWAIIMDDRKTGNLIAGELTAIDSSLLMRGDGSKDRDCSALITPQFVNYLESCPKRVSGFDCDRSELKGRGVGTKRLHFEHIHTKISVDLMPTHEFDRLIASIKAERTPHVIFEENDRPFIPPV